MIYHNIFVRSVYLFFLVIGFLLMPFSVGGIIVAFIAIILDYFLLIIHAKNVERSLPFDYLQRAGQLSIFGYNVLPDQVEEEEVAAFNPNPNVYVNNDIDVNDNQIQVTAASMDRFSTKHLDAPMVVGAHQNDDHAVLADKEREAVSNEPSSDPEVDDNENNDAVR